VPGAMAALPSGTIAGAAMGARGGAAALKGGCCSGLKMACDRALAPDTYGVRSAVALDLQKSPQKHHRERPQVNMARIRQPNPRASFSWQRRHGMLRAGFGLISSQVRNTQSSIKPWLSYDYFMTSRFQKML
jgi:hypothetical protein